MASQYGIENKILLLCWSIFNGFIPTQAQMSLGSSFSVSVAPCGCYWWFAKSISHRAAFQHIAFWINIQNAYLECTSGIKQCCLIVSGGRAGCLAAGRLPDNPLFLLAEWPWPRHFNPNCSRWAEQCLAWQIPPLVYGCVYEWVNVRWSLETTLNSHRSEKHYTRLYIYISPFTIYFTYGHILLVS